MIAMRILSSVTFATLFAASGGVALGSGWQHWIALTAQDAASPISGVAAVSRSPNTMEVFWVGPYGTVKNANYQDGRGWSPVPLAPTGSANVASGVAAVSRSLSTMDVFWISPYGSLTHENYHD